MAKQAFSINVFIALVVQAGKVSLKDKIVGILIFGLELFLLLQEFFRKLSFSFSFAFGFFFFIFFWIFVRSQYLFYIAYLSQHGILSSLFFIDSCLVQFLLYFLVHFPTKLVSHHQAHKIHAPSLARMKIFLCLFICFTKLDCSFPFWLHILQHVRSSEQLYEQTLLKFRCGLDLGLVVESEIQEFLDI